MNLADLSHLFDDMEAEMNAVFDLDSVIANANSRIAEYEQKIKDREAAEEAARQKASELEVQVAALRGQIKELDKQRSIAVGEVSSACHNVLYLRRLIRDREGQIAKRKKDLTMTESQRRLRMIGKDLKRNIGRRGGGGVDVVEKI